jgi:uncharacterized membrane protein
MDFNAMIETWRNVLSRPGVPVFEEERAKPAATLTTGLVWMVIAAVIASLLGWLRTLLFAGGATGMDQLLNGMELPPEVSDQMALLLGSVVTAGAVGVGTLMGIVIAPLMFLLVVGIVHLIARLLGGQGEYGKQAYLMAAFQAPLAIVGAILGLVPLLGGCLGFLLTVYGWVLTYFSVKVNYGLSDGKAIAVVVIPFLVVMFLLACAVFAGVGVFMVAAN